MKTLYLLRHAKTERDAPSGEDFDRALTDRGRADSAALGRAFMESGVFPALIVASTARRTQETVEHLTGAWPTVPAMQNEATLYLAPAARLLALIRQIAEPADSALIVAHNPGIEELANQLANKVPSEPFRRLQKKYPTCALATFTISAGSWARTSADLARLTAFSTPKDLAPN